MSNDSENTTNKRIFIRTLSLVMIFLLALYCFRNLVQIYSPISIANTFTHLDRGSYLSKGLLFDLCLFWISFLSIHILWAGVITVSTLAWKRILSDNFILTEAWLLISIIHFSTVLLINSYLYPTSLAAIFRDEIFLSKTLILFLLILITAQFIWGVSQTKYKALTTAIISVVIFSTLYLKIYKSNNYSSINTESPHIFIIGIDGLRPDHLAFRKGGNSQAPIIDNFLSTSIIFDKAYSPMSRTYVAWLSLLKGQYPINHGGRFNLTPPEIVDKSLPLLNALNKKGYKSIYATDERRFNHIDKSYGFSTLVGPKIGAADAIITSAADTPVINIIANTALGKYMFPYIYNNRAYGKTYNPTRFNQDVIQSLSTSKPNFLSVHFCLLHWPYTSKEFISSEGLLWEGNYNHYMYQAMMKKMDSQFDHFISALSRKGFLNNAIIYLISDHGESFMLKGNEITSASGTKTSPLVNSWGHGTNILSEEQSNVLLSYSRFQHGESVTPPSIVEGLFSLIDIAPSLFSELSLNTNEKNTSFDGQALPINNESQPDRFVFVESSTPTKSISGSFIDKNEVIDETGSKYTVADDGRVVLKRDLYPTLIETKQRAVFYGDWQLALIPEKEQPILIETSKKQWHSLSNYKGDAKWEDMLTSLCSHYLNDPGFNAKHCHSLKEF